MLSLTMSDADAQKVLRQLDPDDSFQCCFDLDKLWYPDPLDPQIQSAYGALAEGNKLVLKDYNALCRWRRETGGITTSPTGILVDTSRDSQAQINTAWRDLQDNPAKTLEWKQSNGVFITVDQAKMDEIKQNLAAHISDCFTREANAIPDIDSGAINSTGQIDAIYA